MTQVAFATMTCGIRKNPKKLRNTVHFAGYGAFKVHRQLDIVTSSGFAFWSVSEASRPTRFLRTAVRVAATVQRWWGNDTGTFLEGRAFGDSAAATVTICGLRRRDSGRLGSEFPKKKGRQVVGDFSSSTTHGCQRLVTLPGLRASTSGAASP